MVVRRMAIVVIGVASISLLAACGGQDEAEDTSDIAMASGADREQMLIDGAKEEKNLMWYTTTIPEQLGEPLIAGFEEKYPWANVEMYRANSTDISSKVLKEYKSGTYTVDVVDGTGTASILESADVLQPFSSPALDTYPPEAKDPDGYWGPQLLYFMVTAYNTDAISPSEAPETYEDLLDPQWKGEMSWSTSQTSGGPLFIGNLVSGWGEDKANSYLDDLAAQEMRNVDSSGRAVLDQVISGQAPIGVQLFNDQVEAAKLDGAPVDWVPMSPVTAQYSRVSLAKHPPHPHMAMLFMDFMMGEEGQQIIRDGHGIPAHPDVDALTPELKPEQGGFEAQFVDPDEVLKQTNEWADMYQEKFMG